MNAHEMVSLRQATTQDAVACATILQDWLDQTDWVPNMHTRAETIGFVRDKLIAKNETIVATFGDGPVCGFLSREGAFVSTLYVAADARSKGVGSALLDRAKTQSPRLNLWTFVANDAARRFYARHDFRELRRTDGDNEEGLPDILLEWLQPAPA